MATKWIPEPAAPKWGTMHEHTLPFAWCAELYDDWNSIVGKPSMSLRSLRHLKHLRTRAPEDAYGAIKACGLFKFAHVGTAYEAFQPFHLDCHPHSVSLDCGRPLAAGVDVKEADVQALTHVCMPSLVLSASESNSPCSSGGFGSPDSMVSASSPDVASRTALGSCDEDGDAGDACATAVQKDQPVAMSPSRLMPHPGLSVVVLSPDARPWSATCPCGKLAMDVQTGGMLMVAVCYVGCMEARLLPGIAAALRLSLPCAHHAADALVARFGAAWVQGAPHPTIHLADAGPVPGLALFRLPAYAVSEAMIRQSAWRLGLSGVVVQHRHCGCVVQMSCAVDSHMPREVWAEFRRVVTSDMAAAMQRNPVYSGLVHVLPKPPIRYLV